MSRQPGWRHSQARARHSPPVARRVCRAEPPRVFIVEYMSVLLSSVVGYLLKAPRAESSSTVRWATSRARLSWVFLNPPGPERDPAQGAAQFPHGLVEVFHAAVDGAGHQCFLHSRETSSASHRFAAFDMISSARPAFFAAAFISSGVGVDQGLDQSRSTVL